MVEYETGNILMVRLLKGEMVMIEEGCGRGGRKAALGSTWS